ncbi:MAG TPA: CbtA family protein [Aeromicrobium sp.]|nr:CbtA family protein [Aeromicrobium sp.]
MNAGQFLVRGLLAGLIAGLAAFGVAYAVGEPQVAAAIALEEAQTDHSAADEAGHGHDEGGTPAIEVSRANQSTWGLLTGTVAIGVAMGGITALAAAFALGRIGTLKPTQTTALVALLGFVAIGLIPFLKYPATPPAVGNAETIGQRTTLYFAFIGICIVAVIIETVFAALLLRRGSSAYAATVFPTLGFLSIVGLAAYMLPAVNEVGDFPADTLWYFRRASILTTAALWATLGIVLTGLIRRPQARRDLAASL